MAPRKERSTRQLTLKDILSGNSDLGTRLVPTLSELSRLVNLLKREGYRIVLTQGVWDLLHEGHAKYLALAKKEGDILIVAVDSDKLTRDRKGPNRPIVPQSERLNMLAHLRHVDMLFLRELSHGMDASNKVIQTVRPDVLIVSKTTSDLTPSQVRSISKFAKIIVHLNPQSTTSTTARIRNLTIEGAQRLSKKITELIDDFLKHTSI